MEPFIILIFIIGLISFSMVWMPALTSKIGISYSVFYLLAGIILYWLFSEYLPSPLPKENESAILHLTELIVIISLMGAGIKIDKSFSLKNWSLSLRLVFIAMFLCIIAAAAMGYFFLNLTLASALLLGAVLAPTDPVLASDVQVSPPNEKSDSETRFTLTSEAGLNDGMAFPFTWLAITFAALAEGKDTSLLYWFSYHFVYQIILGVVVGIILGKVTGYLVFNFSKKFRFLESLDGFLAISLTLVAYGFTELLHGYGFIAVFVSAITLRGYEKDHEYHKSMHSFTEQIEKFFVAVLLILFGGALYLGILSEITWTTVLFAVVFLFIVRPLMALISLIGAKINIKEKLAISFFGIRGLGSIFYLSYAFHEISFESEDQLWSIVALTIALSILVHGISATPVMRYLGK